MPAHVVSIQLIERIDRRHVRSERHPFLPARVPQPRYSYVSIVWRDPGLPISITTEEVVSRFPVGGDFTLLGHFLTRPSLEPAPLVNGTEDNGLFGSCLAEVEGGLDFTDQRRRCWRGRGRGANVFNIDIE